VKRLARTGTRRLIIAAPGFAADCLETLEELDMENRGVFFANGGDKFSYVPCLNDGVLGMTALAAIVRRELQGWI
jgi:ferrochelatase